MKDHDIDWQQRAAVLNLQVRNCVGGLLQSGTGATVVEKFAPRDGRLLYQFANGGRDVDAAVVNSRRAFSDGRWSRLPIQRRKDVLYRLAALIEEHREELALLESLDVGKPIRDALNFDVPTAAAVIRFNAEAADKIYGRVYGSDRTSLSYQLTRPLGVVGGIVGWNFPLVLAAGKIGPVLATGNCLVLKPSELTSLSAVRLAELALDAGVPEGVFNVVHGNSEAGAALAIHGDVDLISFTGSSQTGKKLAVAAGQSNLKRLILECGGKSASIVFADGSDLDVVAESVVRSAFWNQGEVCTASSRLLVQSEIKEELLRRVLQKTSALCPGDPLRPETQFGALVSASHREKVLRYIALGEEGGGKVVYRSAPSAPFKNGSYLAPVVFDAVAEHSVLAQEEIFGPVLVVMSFRDEDEAIRIANGTIYGLSSTIWTKNLGKGHRVAEGIQVGWTVVNATDKPSGGPGEGVLSVGGHKQSGFGTEGGLEGLEAYTARTAVQYFV